VPLELILLLVWLLLARRARRVQHVLPEPTLLWVPLPRITFVSRVHPENILLRWELCQVQPVSRVHQGNIPLQWELSQVRLVSRVYLEVIHLLELRPVPSVQLEGIALFQVIACPCNHQILY
jgi:hypothetical protein